MQIIQDEPCLLYMQQKNWEKNHLHLMCEPSEYGWSDELSIIIQSTKGGQHHQASAVSSFLDDIINILQPVKYKQLSPN